MNESSELLNQLNHLLPTLPQQYHRLLLIAGPHDTVKMSLLKELNRQQDIPYLNVNLNLSQRLLDLTTKERPLRVRRILTQIINDHPEPTLALDNIMALKQKKPGSPKRTGSVTFFSYRSGSLWLNRKYPFSYLLARDANLFRHPEHVLKLDPF